MEYTSHGRDIKGANILVDPKGEVKLVDFGMAKHVRIFTLSPPQGIKMFLCFSRINRSTF